MSQTKGKPLRTRDFLKFFPRNSGIHLEEVFFKIYTRNRILHCKSNNKTKKAKTQYSF